LDEPSTPSARPVLDYAPAPDRIGRKIFRSLLLIAIVLPTGAIGAGIAYLLEPATYTPTGFLAVNMPAGSADANVNLMTQFKRAHAASLVKLARKMQIDARI
jgi:hypothetical protein